MDGNGEGPREREREREQGKRSVIKMRRIKKGAGDATLHKHALSHSIIDKSEYVSFLNFPKIYLFDVFLHAK